MEWSMYQSDPHLSKPYGWQVKVWLTRDAVSSFWVKAPSWLLAPLQKLYQLI